MKTKYIIYFITSIFCVIFATLIPKLLSIFIDNFLYFSTKEYIFKSLLLVIMVGLEMITLMVSYHYNFELSNRLMVEIESEVVSKVMKASYFNIQNINYQHLAQRINNDSVVISDYIIEKFPNLLFEIMRLILIFSFLYTLSKLFVILGILAVGIYFFMYFITKSTYYKLNMKMENAQSNFFSTLGGQLFNVLLVKLNSWYNKVYV